MKDTNIQKANSLKKENSLNSSVNTKSSNLSIFNQDNSLNNETTEKIITTLLNNISSEIINESNPKNSNNNYNNNNQKNIISTFSESLNAKGKQYEYLIYNLLSNILICLSEGNDFIFKFDYKPNMIYCNKVFEQYKLKYINKIQFDFIVNLNFNLFNRFFEYLLPNILYLRFNDFIYCKQFDNNGIENVKDKIKNTFQNNNIDIIGEIGLNIFSNDKIKQLNKYIDLLNNLEYLNDNEFKEYETINEELNLNKDNKKIILFICNSNFKKIYDNIVKFNGEFIKMMEKVRQNIILMFISGGENESNLIKDYLIKNKKKNNNNKDDIIMKKIINNNINYSNNIYFEVDSIKLNNIVYEINNIEKYYSSYLNNLDEFKNITIELNQILNMFKIYNFSIDNFIKFPELATSNNIKLDKKKGIE